MIDRRSTSAIARAHVFYQQGHRLLAAENFGPARRAYEAGYRLLAPIRHSGSARRLRFECRLGVARVLRQSGGYREASRLFGSLLRVFGKPGTDPVRMALFLTEAGAVQKYRGDLVRAARLQERAWRCLMTAPATARRESVESGILHNLAGLAHDRGALRLAEQLARASMERNRSGEPAVSFTRLEMGSILLGQRRFQEARHQYRLAMKRIVPVIGARSAPVAHALYGLGVACHLRGQRMRAKALYLDALSIQIELLPKSPELGLTLNNLGALCDDGGEVAQARRYYRRALHIFSSTMRKGHPRVRICAENLRALHTDARKAGGER